MQTMVEGNTHTQRTTEERGAGFPRHNQLNVIFFEDALTAVMWLQVLGEWSAFIEGLLIGPHSLTTKELPARRRLCSHDKLSQDVSKWLLSEPTAARTLARNDELTAGAH